MSEHAETINTALHNIATGWRIRFHGYDPLLTADTWEVYHKGFRQVFIGTRDTSLGYYLSAVNADLGKVKMAPHIQELNARQFSNPHHGHADEYGT